VIQPSLACILLASTLWLLPAAAAAQDGEPPLVSVAAGAGRAFPFHSDFSFNAFAWQASARVRTARHFLMEGTYEQWRHTTERTFRNITLQGPNGVIGRVDEIRTEDTDTVTYAGLNLLGTGAIGRARISGGAGAGAMIFGSRFRQTLIGCTSSQPETCGEFTSRHDNYGFGLQALGELDVSIVPTLSAFARFTLAGPIEDPGAGHTALVGGVRFNIR
jgi:hypothetical protein